jgi:hypothetical protein
MVEELAKKNEEDEESVTETVTPVKYFDIV